MPLSLRTETQRHSMLFFQQEQRRSVSASLRTSVRIHFSPSTTPRLARLPLTNVSRRRLQQKQGPSHNSQGISNMTLPNLLTLLGETLRTLRRKSPDAPEKVSGCFGESLRMLRRKSPDALEEVSGCSGDIANLFVARMVVSQKMCFSTTKHEKKCDSFCLFTFFVYICTRQKAGMLRVIRRNRSWLLCRYVKQIVM